MSIRLADFTMPTRDADMRSTHIVVTICLSAHAEALRFVSGGSSSIFGFRDIADLSRWCIYKGLDELGKLYKAETEGDCMKEVVAALKAEQKRLSRELKKVESLLSRSGGGGAKKARKKRAAKQQEEKATAAAPAKKAGKRKANADGGRTAEEILADKRKKRAALQSESEE